MADYAARVITSPTDDRIVLPQLLQLDSLRKTRVAVDIFHMGLVATYVMLDAEQYARASLSPQMARDVFDRPTKFGARNCCIDKSWDFVCWALSPLRRATKDLISGSVDDLIASAIFGRDVAPAAFVDALAEARVNPPPIVARISAELRPVDFERFVEHWDGRAMVRGRVYGIQWETRDDPAEQEWAFAEFIELRKFYDEAADRALYVVASVI